MHDKVYPILHKRAITLTITRRTLLAAIPNRLFIIFNKKYIRFEAYKVAFVDYLFTLYPRPADIERLNFLLNIVNNR